MRETLEKIGADMGHLVVEVGGLRSDVNGLTAGAESMRSDMGSMRIDLDGLRAEVGDLRSDVGGLTADIKRLDANVQRNSVLIEAVDDKIVILAEGQEALHEKTDHIRSTASSVEEKVDQIDARLICVEIVPK